MITTAVILVAVLGGVFGLVLATASKKFAVEEDPRIGAGLPAAALWLTPLFPDRKKTPPNAWSAAQKTRKPLPL